ncbi:nuclear transport factor 2 family protein [Sphingomonas gei]|nr:nuclear transport factor 2 family protein [Sphingomonas gei]
MASLPAFAQTTPVAPIVKGTALPPPGTEAAVLAPVNALFAGLASRDGAAMAATLHGDGGITVAVAQPDGTKTIRQQKFAEWAAGIKPGPERYEERMPAPAIEIDGDIAMVWGDYVFLIDGKLSHCGVDHFSLVRVDGQWKITNLAWTSRTTDCPAQ